MRRQQVQKRPRDERRRSSLRSFSVRVFIIILLIGFSVPLMYGGWREMYSNYIEVSPPTIEFTVLPRGIGIAPTQVKFRVNDIGAGLADIVVRMKNHGQTKEILRRSLKGEHVVEETLSFPGPESGLEEGMVQFEIRAFDRALWSNRGELTAQLRVDYRKPNVEALSKQHNARRGGSQMIFYKVFDESPAISGVRVGSRMFNGYLAKGLDKTLEDPNLYVALYAIPLDERVSEKDVYLFAEDSSGNTSSATFYNKIADRSLRPVDIQITEEFLREQASKLYEQNFSKLSSIVSEYDNNTLLQSLDPLVKKFKIINDGLRLLNEQEISERLSQSPRFESFFEGVFIRQATTIQLSYGDAISYKYQGAEIGRGLQRGEEVQFARGERDVAATNDGIVLISDNMGYFGRMVVIDHGLGLTSLYGRLDEISVRPGEEVAKGQIIGRTGRTGFARNLGLYYEMRIHGTVVDPVEWRDTNWFNPHITGKINELKRDLGLPVYIPFQ